MPVARRRAFYGENPEQSQSGAAGTLYLPSASSSANDIPPTGGVSLLVSSPESIPNLGYSWEIVNYGLNGGILLQEGFTGEEKGTRKIVITLSILLGARTLYSQTQEVEIKWRQSGLNIDGAAGFSFSENPPQSISVPSGQQLSIKIDAFNKTRREEEGFTDLMILYLSEEPVFAPTLKIIPVASFINYHFV